MPFAEVDLLRGSGLLKLLVPTTAGGPGESWREAVAATTVVAAADASIGHILGYHYLNHFSALPGATPAQAAAINGGVLNDGWFLGDSVNPLDPGLTVVREGDTVVLDGKRSFATGAAVADRILLTFKVGDRAVATLLPRDRQGVYPNEDWDNMGQRGTASGSLSFKEVRIGVDEILGPGLDAPEPTPTPSPISPMIQTTLSAVQVGLAQGALAAAAAYTREQSRAWFKSGKSRAVDDPLIAAPYGRLSAQTAAAAALLRETVEGIQAAIDKGRDLTEAERAAIAVASFQIKIVSTELALEVTSKVFELMGARASGNRFGFDRYWRDARTLTLHDPVAYKQLEVGRYVLLGELPEPTTYS